MTFNKCFFNDSRPIYNDNKWYEKETTLQKGKDDAGDFLWLDAAVADHNLDPLFSGVFAANNLKPTRQTTLGSLGVIKSGLIRVYALKNYSTYIVRDSKAWFIWSAKVSNALTLVLQFLLKQFLL